MPTTLEVKQQVTLPRGNWNAWYKLSDIKLY